MSAQEKTLRASFVVPWYGAKIPGGAEAEARHTIQNLVRAGVSVQVLTTCLAGLGSDWDHDALPPGLSEEDGIAVRRFPTSGRDGGRFNALNGRVISGDELSGAEEDAFFRNMVHSQALLDYIAAHPEEGPFFFIPYLFTTSVWGPLVHPSKSVIIPCLHDEGYARMAGVKRAFESSRAVVFHVPAEAALAKRLYDMEKTEPLILGEGVDTHWQCDGKRFKDRFNIDHPFVLYAGRKDAGKNTPLLCQYFLRYVKERNGAGGLKLLLIGNLPAPIPPGGEKYIRDLGFVEVQEKYDAYAAAEVFIQPSLMESFSIVIMESWLAETPVMVHTGCAVTKDHAEMSHGGLHFADYPHFAEGLDLLLKDPKLRARMGRAGRRYVIDNYSWPVITKRFTGLIERLSQEPIPPARRTTMSQTPRKTKHKGPAVHQMLPDFSYGDAIGNDVLAIQKCLRSWGLESEIFAEHVHTRLAGRCRRALEYPSQAGPDDVLMFHFSIGHALADKVPGMPGRKVLRYHNITPAKFLEKAYPQSAKRAELGREQLKRLAPAMELGLGVSAYNCAELEDAGCPLTEVVPILLDTGHLATQPDPLILSRFCGPRKNILHVGRIAPNKCIEDLIKTQYWLAKIRPGTRLLLVGGGFDGGRSAYGGGLKQLVQSLGVPDVHFSDHVTTAQLMAYYRAADLYLCLSEHEGFCVPLVEAMHFGLPVAAFASSAIPDTLGHGGILLKDKSPHLVAETINAVLEDDALAQSLSRAGRQRREDFRAQKVSAALREVLSRRLGLDLSHEA